MPFEDDDTRKVRTAVIGRAGSDRPVFLPYDHDDFDRFMRGRTREDFYCGILLGGCGKKLTAKRYLDKKCHFAHRPPVHCRRTATGEDSADHLYIGQAVQRWLRRQAYRSIEVSYPDLGSGPGGAVEIRFGPGARLIRVQLARLPLHAWRATRERLTDRHPSPIGRTVPTAASRTTRWRPWVMPSGSPAARWPSTAWCTSECRAPTTRSSGRSSTSVT
ncbi:competence protein CoiA [Streptomyces sp. NBC_01799]|nr:competence protein CoiA [Streptomyces sp. NBC_01799]